MIEDYFKPLALQTDLGLGATADSFYYAAQALDDNQDTKYGFGIGGGKLPILYLYRHSIELYLKSAITLIYKISFKKSKTGNDDFPKLVENGKEKKIFNVHSIKTLFENFLIIFSVHDKFHRTLILSGFCLLKIAKISLNSSFFPKPIKR